MRRVILRALCWPLFLGSLVVLLVRAAWGSDLWWSDGCLMARLSLSSWPARTWYRRWGGTTFGYGIMLAPASGDQIVQHELVHVEQAEANTLAGLALGALASLVSLSPWPLLVGWLGGAIMAYLGATLTAWLRSEPDAYRGNHLEEAAYNATEAKCSVHLSDK